MDKRADNLELTAKVVPQQLSPAPSRRMAYHLLWTARRARETSTIRTRQTALRQVSSQPFGFCNQVFNGCQSGVPQSGILQIDACSSRKYVRPVRSTGFQQGKVSVRDVRKNDAAGVDWTRRPYRDNVITRVTSRPAASKR